MGAVVGLALVAPITIYRRGFEPHGLLKTLGTTCLATTTAALLLGAGRVASIPADERPAGLQDRAYRLHYNKGQNRVDLFGEIGMAIGGSAAMMFVSPAVLVVLGGAAAGSAVGVLTHVATNKSEAT